MNMHVCCYEHACIKHLQGFAFNPFAKGRFYQGVGSIAGSYYNFIFNIMGNNSVLHSNYTILNSFQLSTRVKIPPDPYRHVSFFCLSVLVFVQCARQYLVVIWMSCS